MTDESRIFIRSAQAAALQLLFRDRKYVPVVLIT